MKIKQAKSFQHHCKNLKDFNQNHGANKAIDKIKNSLISCIENQDEFQKASLEFLKSIKLIKSIKDEHIEDLKMIEPPG